MNIRAKTSLARLSVGLATTLLVACGGGDSGNGTPVIGGIQGSGRMVSIGTITGFGSIFVNGVEFATSTAQITLDGRAGTEADLRIGQVVTVQGTVNANGTAGTATRVTFDNDVEGPVTQLDVAAGTFVVLGQTIRVTGSTHFDASIVPSRIEGLADLPAGLQLYMNITGIRTPGFDFDNFRYTYLSQLYWTAYSSRSVLFQR